MIPFVKLDIGEKEIAAVISTMKSGWLTTGPQVIEFEKVIKERLQCKYTIATNSATAALFLALKTLDLKEGDEVIVPALTFASTANVILHNGAKPVIVDTIKDKFHIDPDDVARKISSRTRAIISVEYGGQLSNLQAIRDIIANQNHDICFISDSAHSFGATYQNRAITESVDFAAYSFHAVKNLITGEGGALCFGSNKDTSERLKEQVNKLRLLSLHGQNKNAYEKYHQNQWEYDILEAGYKFNMPEINAAIGIIQIERFYNEFLPARKKIYDSYCTILKEESRIILPEFDVDGSCTFHLFPILIDGIDEEKRNTIIQKMFDAGVSLNVHYKPLTMLGYYKKLGYDYRATPHAYDCYVRQMSLPFYPSLTKGQVEEIATKLMQVIQSV